MKQRVNGLELSCMAAMAVMTVFFIFTTPHHLWCYGLVAMVLFVAAMIVVN